MKRLFITLNFKLVIIFLVLIVLSMETKAQFRSATVGIDGLTCSMCSNSVEKLIRQLDFVAAVKMDLNTTTAQVTFHPGKKVNMADLSKKVFDAGFSVRSLQGLFNFESAVNAGEGKSYIYEGDEYIFVKKTEVIPQGETILTFIGKNFISQKEFSHWKSIVSNYKGTVKGKAKVYHIAL
jgi:copper chaperone CopZ